MVLCLSSLNAVVSVVGRTQFVACAAALSSNNQATQQQQPRVSQANNNKSSRKGGGDGDDGGWAVSNVSLFTAFFDLACYALKFSKLRCLRVQC